MLGFKKRASRKAAQESDHNDDQRIVVDRHDDSKENGGTEMRPPRLNEEHPIWTQPGPRTVDEVDTSKGYHDMGSLLVPSIKGMQIQTQPIDGQNDVVRVLFVLGSSGVEVLAAAAPRSGGVWDEVREDLKEVLESQGASVECVDTRYGKELIADVPSELPDGSLAASRIRIIGREGPRWFVRIDIVGPAAQTLDAGKNMETFIDRMVVVRDDQPRARLDLLPLHAPLETRADTE